MSTASEVDRMAFAVGDLVFIQTSSRQITGRVTWTEAAPMGRFQRISISHSSGLGDSMVLAREGIVRVLSSEPPDEQGSQLGLRATQFREMLRAESGHAPSFEARRALGMLYDLLTSDSTLIPEWQRLTVATGNSPHIISYATRPEHVDTEKRRRKVKLSTFLSAMNRTYNLALDQSRIELMAYHYGVSIPDPSQFSFEVVSGADIVRVYDDDVVDTCMTGKGYVELYARNPDNVRLLVINRSGSFVGRALIWTTDQGRICLDRIYPSDGGMHIELARRYAAEQGWASLERQTYGQQFDDGKEYTVTLKNTRTFPYLDTFRFCKDPYQNPLVLKTFYRSNDYTLEYTDGTPDGSGDQDYDDDAEDDGF